MGRSTHNNEAMEYSYVVYPVYGDTEETTPGANTDTPQPIIPTTNWATETYISSWSGTDMRVGINPQTVRPLMLSWSYTSATIGGTTELAVGGSSRADLTDNVTLTETGHTTGLVRRNRTGTSGDYTSAKFDHNKATAEVDNPNLRANTDAADLVNHPAGWFVYLLKNDTDTAFRPFKLSSGQLSCVYLPGARTVSADGYARVFRAPFDMKLHKVVYCTSNSGAGNQMKLVNRSKGSDITSYTATATSGSFDTYTANAGKVIRQGEEIGLYCDHAGTDFTLPGCQLIFSIAAHPYRPADYGALLDVGSWLWRSGTGGHGVLHGVRNHSGPLTGGYAVISTPLVDVTAAGDQTAKGHIPAPFDCVPVCAYMTGVGETIDHTGWNVRAGGTQIFTADGSISAAGGPQNTQTRGTIEKGAALDVSTISRGTNISLDMVGGTTSHAMSTAHLIVKVTGYYSDTTELD